MSATASTTPQALPQRYLARRLFRTLEANGPHPSRRLAHHAAAPSATALDRNRCLLSIAFGIRACLAGHRVAFRTATEWVALLADAQRHGRLDAELDRLQRMPLLIVDEAGFIP